jgi:hypothetical protein
MDILDYFTKYQCPHQAEWREAYLSARRVKGQTKQRAEKARWKEATGWTPKIRKKRVRQTPSLYFFGIN